MTKLIMTKLIVALLTLAVCINHACAEEESESCEQVVFSFIQNGILGRDAGKLQKILTDPIVLWGLPATSAGMTPFLLARER